MRDELQLLIGMLGIVIFIGIVGILTSIDTSHAEEVKILELQLQKKQYELELKECQALCIQLHNKLKNK